MVASRTITIFTCLPTLILSDLRNKGFSFLLQLHYSGCNIVFFNVSVSVRDHSLNNKVNFVNITSAFEFVMFEAYM